MPKLLLIDDEPAIQHTFRRVFHPPEFETLTVRTAAEGQALIAKNRPDVVVLDVHLPDATRLDAFERIIAQDARLPIILITGHGTTELAIEAMKRGAFDYLLKPLQYDRLREAVDRACESARLMTVPAILAGTESPPDEADALIGQCEAMQEVYKSVGQVSGTDATVLITGESGTGKELVARAIYQHSKRSHRPFLAIHCGAIPESLIESELFGHEKGAFTGADRKRIGKFEQCSGGTLFLDEIGDMPPLVQVKLLRVLQDQTFERVGGNETVRTDVRLIAATNVDLEDAVRTGRFRHDLFFRLNVFTIHLPPLRERGSDIDILTDFYLARFAREFGRPRLAVPEATRSALRDYSWPGNVRELQSVLKQGLLRSTGTVLLRSSLNLTAIRPPAAHSPSPSPPEGPDVFDRPPPRATPGAEWEAFIAERLAAGSHNLYAECLEAMERQLLTKILTQTGGNQLRAAELLGITRSSLRHKLRNLGIPAGRSADPDEEP